MKRALHVDMSIDEKGFARLEKLSFDPYNEQDVLITAIENYRKRTGHYPQRTIAKEPDTIRSGCLLIRSIGIKKTELTARTKKSEFLERLWDVLKRNLHRKKRKLHIRITRIVLKSREVSVWLNAALAWD